MVTRRCQRGGGGDLLFFFFCTKMIRLCVLFNLNGFFFFFFTFLKAQIQLHIWKGNNFRLRLRVWFFRRIRSTNRSRWIFFLLSFPFDVQLYTFFLIDLTPLRAWVISAWVYLWKLFKSHSRARSRHPAGIRRNGSATPYPLLRAHQWEFQMQLFAQQVYSQCGSKREKQVFRYKNLTCC